MAWGVIRERRCMGVVLAVFASDACRCAMAMGVCGEVSVWGLGEGAVQWQGSSGAGSAGGAACQSQFELSTFHQVEMSCFFQKL